MAAIERVPVAEDRFADNWGVAVYDYSYQGKAVDLQDIATKVTQSRAVAIEGEVTPMESLIRRRTTKLNDYSLVLSTLTEMQSAEGQQTFNAPQGLQLKNADGEYEVLAELGLTDGQSCSKAQIDGLVQKAKSLIDAANNQQQSDMTRLQALVDRRDESFTTATSVMTEISDTRSSLLKNM